MSKYLYAPSDVQRTTCMQVRYIVNSVLLQHALSQMFPDFDAARRTTATGDAKKAKGKLIFSLYWAQLTIHFVWFCRSGAPRGWVTEKMEELFKVRCSATLPPAPHADRRPPHLALCTSRP
jgi:hypothetical protein